MEQILTMSDRETDRLKVLSDVIAEKLTWNEADTQLDLSGRQAGRLCERVRKDGDEAAAGFGQYLPVKLPHVSVVVDGQYILY
jgi:hypothetical protein